MFTYTEVHVDTQSVKFNICNRNLAQAERKSNSIISIFLDSRAVDVAQISSSYERCMQNSQIKTYSVKLFRSKVLLCLPWTSQCLARSAGKCNDFYKYCFRRFNSSRQARRNKATVSWYL